MHSNVLNSTQHDITNSWIHVPEEAIAIPIIMKADPDPTATQTEEYTAITKYLNINPWGYLAVRNMSISSYDKTE